MNALFKFHEDCGRMGEVESIFVADVDEVNEAIGKTVYFGEILGKHSEVIVDITEENFTKLTEDPVIVAFFEKHVGSIGHNPLEYLESDDE